MGTILFVRLLLLLLLFFFFSGFLETDSALSRYSEVTNNNLRKHKLFVWCVVTVILVVNVEMAARRYGVVSNRIHIAVTGDLLKRPVQR